MSLSVCCRRGRCVPAAFRCAAGLWDEAAQRMQLTATARFDLYRQCRGLIASGAAHRLSTCLPRITDRDSTHSRPHGHPDLSALIMRANALMSDIPYWFVALVLRIPIAGSTCGSRVRPRSMVGNCPAAPSNCLLEEEYKLPLIDPDHRRLSCDLRRTFLPGPAGAGSRHPLRRAVTAGFP